MTRVSTTVVGAIAGFLAGTSLVKPRPTADEVENMSAEDLEQVEPVRVFGGLAGAVVGAGIGWSLGNSRAG